MKYNRIMLGQSSCFAEECRKNSYIGADFEINEDLSIELPKIADWKSFNKKYIPKYQKTHPDKSKVVAGLACGFLWTVCKGLQKGDIVLCPTGHSSYYVGTIDSDYYYIEGSSLPHRRKVIWMDKIIMRSSMSERLRNSAGSIGTCCDLTKYSEEIDQLIKEAGKNTIVDPNSLDSNEGDTIDPEETMRNINLQLQNQLADEILDYIINLSPEQFEKLVLKLLVKMGYGEAHHTGKSGDGGIDGIIDEDKLGLDVIHIQAKRYAIGNNVGSEALQAFVGALAGQNARKGIFITTSDFTKNVKAYFPNGVKIVKINGVRLAKLMIEYNLGVRVKETYEVKGLDKSFFEE